MKTSILARNSLLKLSLGNPNHQGKEGPWSTFPCFLFCKEILVFFECFSLLSFPRILGVRLGRKSLLFRSFSLLFTEKARQRSKGFSLRGTPKILGKGREKRTKKKTRESKENAQKKSKEKKKARELRRVKVVFFCFLTQNSKEKK